MNKYTGNLEDREFIRYFHKLTVRHHAWDVWNDFITMFACAISNPLDKAHFDEREKLYLRTVNKYKKPEQDIFPKLAAEVVKALEKNPEQDYLGHIFMCLELGDRHNGQVFTPYHVCEMMAKMTMHDVRSYVKEKGYFTVNDPACGAGATLIAGINEARKELAKDKLNFQNHILIVAQDIDRLVALMCYIQISLLGVAGYVKIGNSLTEPMTDNDDLTNYWFTPMYFSQVWATRRLFKNLLS